MKKLLILSLLFAFNGFAQNNYTLEKNTAIYDIPGGEFLTTHITNDTTYITHYDVSGNVIWENFLLFTPTLSPVYFGGITRFKTTDEYVIYLYNRLTSSGNVFTNDTFVYQFTKLNLANHSYTGNLIDTFYSRGVTLVEWRDTSMYLFVNDYSFNGPNLERSHATYLLNSSLNKTFVAPKDSISTHDYFCSFHIFEDTIYKYQEASDFHIMDKYSADISLINTYNASTTTNQYLSSNYYEKIINKDSIFIFTQGKNPSVRWSMNWLDLNLNIINKLEFTSPQTDDLINESRYEISTSNVNIDRVNKRIYVLAKDVISPFSSDNHPQKIFVYDYSFNLICELPVNIGNQNVNSLVSLNDLVYLKVKNPYSDYLTILNCDILSTDDITPQDEHKVYPNPTNANVSISNSENKQLTIEVMTLNGQEIMKISKQENLINIDVRELPSGIYLIRISDGATTQVQRIMKE